MWYGSLGKRVDNSVDSCKEVPPSCCAGFGFAEDKVESELAIRKDVEVSEGGVVAEGGDGELDGHSDGEQFTRIVGSVSQGSGGFSTPLVVVREDVGASSAGPWVGVS